MLILNEEIISKIVDPLELTNIMEQAMLSYASGDFVMPDRVHMDFDGNTLLLMPCSSGKFFSTKLVSLFPDNPVKGEPVLYGSVMLNDGSNGKALALLNGAKLTAVRTAAVGSAGIRHTSPKNASTLGLVGAGVQGLHQILFACKNRPIEKVWVLDQNTSLVDTLIKELKVQLPDVEFIAAKDSIELCRESEIIITATNACTPVLPDVAELLRGKTIIAIGSYKPEMIEMPEALYPLLKHCFIDVNMAMEESGDLIHPLSSGMLKTNQIHSLSDIITAKLNIDATETSLYKSVGMALFDLFSAVYIYDVALKSGLGQEVSF
ncbi:MAG: ornithine cyclodeaminase family protein [Bacteroidetes bacterium]|jgi:ornithine cyclodeaminase/alanine dehydrogenase-like protein (mu-crystallin family)|nr:ornithine cyclodeaminase family protein [Bacteroidota bacterium]MBT3750159.1 ornithine cyclodeaminase family protein [Bacteroidota bacterium]MBT4399836.1 ornithine cyclodeaminase family protein [Bacteroidota bacterium]MBT5424905.1 ornithine cyclodeaminase family protein [Bacteroidota bacterium]MBT7092978.1 ornithine cyclodeaminase family protein [Bacteroidota bacterium]